MHYLYAPDISDSEIYQLNEKESHHLMHVLRGVSGDKINLIDGVGNSYEAEITAMNKKNCSIKILSLKQHPPKPYKLHLAVALPKSSERIDFLLEKLTELEVDSITPILTQNSERRKFDHLKEVNTLIAAIKQSGSPFLPQLNALTDFTKFLKNCVNFDGLKYICHCRENEKSMLANLYQTKNNVMICIGPEGDFSKSEISLAQENNFKAASLSKMTLRTETAALNAAIIINTINQMSP